MLDKILQNIDRKAKEEAEKVLRIKEEQFLKLEESFKKDFQEKQKSGLLLLKQKTEKEIIEAKQELKLNNSFKLGKAKKEATYSVYQQAIEQIIAFDDKKFTQIIKRLFTEIPQGVVGEIVAGQRAFSVLKNLAGQKMVIKKGLDEEGFIMKTKDLDIDARISQSLVNNKEETDPKVIKILFS